MAKRRQQRVRVHLDPEAKKNAPAPEDIPHILRAADDCIGRAGRGMLVKILKGSKVKRLLELGLQDCPSYGYYRSKTMDEIGRIVDWMILAGFLEIQYDGRLPMIVFSDRGWEEYKPVYAEEMYQVVLKAAADPEAVEAAIERLKTTNREVILLLLEALAKSKNIGVVRFLEAWSAQEVKKVRAAIRQAMEEIRR